MKTASMANLASVAAIGLMIAAAPASAGSNEKPVANVSAAGLDLDTPKGQKLLDERIERAARSVCGLDQVHTGTRVRSGEARKCVDKARASAKRQIATKVSNPRQGG